MTTTVANQNWKEFNLRYVTDYRLRRSTKGKLLSRILDGIDRHSDRLALAPR